MRAVLLFFSGLALSACGPANLAEAPAAVEYVRDAIVGGSYDTGDPQVFQLTIVGDNQTGSRCTATLIDSRTLLTAAHCVDPRIIGATTVQIYAMNRPDESAAFQSDYIRLIETRYHPSWNPNTLENDIAVALLEKVPLGVTPKPWNTTSLAGYSGKPLRAVGYGTTGIAGTGGGLKRQVDLSFRQLTSELIWLGNQSNKGICHGDSGGPSFHTFTDGIERVVGVHSFTVDQNCVDGADARVDRHATFIQTWLSQREAPTCGEDGRCASSCPQVDLDCVCKADGQCTTACPNLLKDPDCPPDCVANNICATAACPMPDSDCVAVGNTCSTPTQCVGRKCVTDAQHGDPYCSKSCATSNDCPPQMECDGTSVCRYKQLPVVTIGGVCVAGQQACELGAVCAGDVAGYTTCSPACTLDTDCAADRQCVVGLDGQKFCREKVKPAILLERAKAEGFAASEGCSAAPVGVGAWVMLAGLLRRRRSR